MAGGVFPNGAVSIRVANEAGTATELKFGEGPAGRVGGGVGAAETSSEPAPVESH